MRTFFIFLLFSVWGVVALGKPKTKVLTTDLKRPWAVVATPSGDLLITEKEGQIHIYGVDGQKKTSLKGLPADLEVKGQGGLLEFAYHPSFDKNSWVYMCYVTDKNTNPKFGYNTRVSRFTLETNELKNEKVLVQGGYGTDGAHFGCRLVFDINGHLFATFGERHNKFKAQSLEFLNGKVIRIDENGGAVKDNPFVNKANARPEIFTLGHRNPQGIDIHPESQKIYISEHGPSHYDAETPKDGSVGNADEINEIKKGRNYGWPNVFGDPKIISWTEEMKKFAQENNVQMPLREYSVPDGIAPSGISFYLGDKLGEWKNNLFVAALRGHIRRLEIDKKGNVLAEEVLFDGDFGRVRDVTTGPDGYLYFITDSGRLVKVLGI